MVSCSQSEERKREYYTTKKGAEEADFTLDYIKDKHQEIGI